MKTVYILRGVPGCGKSKVADNLHYDATHSGKTAIICCADDFLVDVDGNYIWLQETIGHAHLWCKKEYTDALIEGIDTIILSNTNIKNSDVKFYRNLAIEYGYTVIVLAIENWHGGTDEHDCTDEMKLQFADTLRNNMKLFEMPTIEIDGKEKPLYKLNKQTNKYEKINYENN